MEKLVLKRGCLYSHTPDKQYRYESNYGAKNILSNYKVHKCK